MDKKNIWIIIALTLVVYLSFCGQDKQSGRKQGQVQGHSHKDESADHSHEPDTTEAQDDATHFHINSDLFRQWGIRFESPASRMYSSKLKLTGTVTTNNNRSVVLNSMVSGIVSDIRKDIGQQVKQGDVLCTINSRELLEIKSGYIKAHQKYLQSRANYQRAKELFKIKAIEQKEMFNRETECKTSMADYFSLEAQLRSIGFSAAELEVIKQALINDNEPVVKTFLTPFYQVRASLSGTVIDRSLKYGQRIETNNTIFEISDTSRIWAIFDAQEKDLSFLAKGKQVIIQRDNYPKDNLQGVINNISEKIDPQLRTIKVRIVVQNTKGILKPNMFVIGIIKSEEKKNYLSVPRSALVKVSGIDAVFINDGDGMALRPVEVIDTDSEGFVFLIGLKPEDYVVVNGAFFLKAEFEIQKRKGDSASDHGHEH